MKFMKKQNCNINFYNIAWPLVRVKLVLKNGEDIKM